MDASSVTRHPPTRGADGSPAPLARASWIRRVAASLGLLAILVLVGCDGDGSAPQGTGPTTSTSTANSPSPSDPSTATKTAQPKSSKEKAVAQAKRQLRAFFKTHDDLLSDPTLSLGILENYASSRALQDNRDAIGDFRNRGWVQQGRTRVFHVRSGLIRIDPHGVSSVELRVCYDLREARILDKNGNLVDLDALRVAAARYLLATPDWPLEGPRQWRVDRQEVAGKPCHT